MNWQEGVDQYLRNETPPPSPALEVSFRLFDKRRGKGEPTAIGLAASGVALPPWNLNGSSRPDGRSETIVPAVRAFQAAAYCAPISGVRTLCNAGLYPWP